MASPYRVFDLRVKNARRAVADLRTSADVGHETAQQSGELLWRLLVRRMPGPRQHLYGAAPQVRYGQSAQVLQADELIARPVQDRQRPGQPRDDVDLVGEPALPDAVEHAAAGRRVGGEDVGDEAVERECRVGRKE